MNSCLTEKKTVDSFCKALEANGCKVVRDNEAMTIQAFEGGFCVYKAIGKGSGIPWIVRCQDGVNIKWSK